MLVELSVILGVRGSTATNSFWPLLAAAAIGSGLTLVGVFLTLRKQDERDRFNDERHLRDRKHDRLREAYRTVVATAHHYAHYSAVLALADQQARTKGDPEHLMRAVKQGQPDFGDAHAALLLETDDDKAILDKLGDLATAHYAFAFALISDGGIDADEGQRQLAAMQAAVDELAALARERLAALDEPLGG